MKLPTTNFLLNQTQSKPKSNKKIRGASELLKISHLDHVDKYGLHP